MGTYEIYFVSNLVYIGVNYIEVGTYSMNFEDLFTSLMELKGYGVRHGLLLLF